VTRRTFGDRFFGWGRLPADLRAEMEREDLRFCEEGAPASLTLRNYRAPGRFVVWRRQGGSGAIAVSAKRLVLAFYRRSIVHLRFDDSRFDALEITRTARGLEIAFDVERLDETRSGRVVCRLRTDRADEYLEWIAAGRRLTPGSPSRRSDPEGVRRGCGRRRVGG
jgi:hypothetical protein